MRYLLFLTLILAGCYTQIGYVVHTAPATDPRPDTISESLVVADTAGDTIQYKVVKRQEETPRDTIIIREKEREIWVWEQDHWGWWELRRYDDRSPHWRAHVAMYRYGNRGGFYPNTYYDPYWYNPWRSAHHRDTLIVIVDSTQSKGGNASLLRPDGGGRPDSNPAVKPPKQPKQPTIRTDAPKEKESKETQELRSIRHGRGR